MQACSSSKFRRHLLANNLALASPFHPEAGFNAGNAMQRNKYIYCLADAALVVHSGTKGGTWNGAVEDLRSRWVPLWIKPTEDRSAGNADLVAQGARWTTAHAEHLDVGCLIASTDESASGQHTSQGVESVNERVAAFTTDALPVSHALTHQHLAEASRGGEAHQENSEASPVPMAWREAGFSIRWLAE